MTPTRHSVHARGPIACALGLLLTSTLWPATAALAAVPLRLSPPHQFVEPGAEFDVSVVLEDSTTTFDGFHVVLEFDPDHLTPVPLAPLSQQEGCLMTGECSDACGQTFHRFSAEGDSAAAPR